MLHSVLTGALVASLALPNAPALVDLASRAGHDISARVFLTQQTSEVERRCRAEAQREQDTCESEGRENCDELYESHLAVCLAAAPASGSPPTQEPARARTSSASRSGKDHSIWLIIALGALATWGLHEAGKAAQEEGME